MTHSEQDVYALIGPEAFERLVDAFYARVAEEPVLRALYPDEDLRPAAWRLRLFLEQYFGGPRSYEQERGHPRLRMRHASFRIDQTARDAWVRHMLAALDEAGIPEPARTTLRMYFEQTATGLINRVMPG